MKKLLSVFLFLLFGMSFYAQEVVKSKSDIIFSTDSWEQILQIAQKENKLIFVDLYFEGCHPCAEMEEDVYPSPTVATVLQKDFISFKSDVFKEDIGKKMSMKYAVSGFPTLLVLTPKMEVLNIASGFYGVDEFHKFITSAKELYQQKKYKKFSTSFDLDYPEFYRAAYLQNKRNFSFEEIDAYLKTQKSLEDEIPFAIITGLRIGGAYSEYIYDNAQQLANDYGSDAVGNIVLTTALSKSKTFGEENNIEAFDNVLVKIKPIFTESDWVRYNELLKNQFKESKEN